MSEQNFNSQEWWKALSLNERLAILRQEEPASDDYSSDPHLAQERFERWRTRPAFKDGTVFNRRLHVGGISENEFRKALGMSPVSLPGVSAVSPPWANFFQRELNSESVDLQVSYDGELSSHPLHASLALIHPSLGNARARLRKYLDRLRGEYSCTAFETEVLERAFFQNLPGQLLQIMERTLVLELHVARLKGHLKGISPRERLENFIVSLQEPEMRRAFYAEYPVLIRVLSTCIERWLSASTRFARDLCADWPKIREKLFGNGELGTVTAVHYGLGDQHRGGQSVLMAKFSCGRRVIYKPRAMSVDVHFQELLSWLNERGRHPAFRILVSIDQGDHGWVEYVESGGCTNERQLERFYQRHGAYLALLYVLQATDFHNENIIAAGEHPVLVDLETLFHPRVKRTSNDGAGHFLSNLMNQSVLHIGLLPRRIFFSGSEQSIDFSGIGASAKQTTPFDVPQWEDYGTDQMRVVRKSAVIEALANRPMLSGREINPADYTDAILKGFSEMYDLLWRHRADLGASNGLLHRFANDEVRSVLRMTRTYGRLLYESYHPDVLRDALDRDCLLDSLWLEQGQSSVLDQIVNFEKEDLSCGDIPIFTTRADSVTLWTSTSQVIPEFFADSGLSIALRNLKRLSERDQARQLWLIEASMASLNCGRQRRSSALAASSPVQPLDWKRCIRIAKKIGDRLVELCAEEDDYAGWIKIEPKGGNVYDPALALFDLYDGVPGVALFLAQLGDVTGDIRYTQLAKKSISTLLAAIDIGYLSPTGIGAFTGWGGVIYTLTHLGALWRDSSLFKSAFEGVAKLAPLIEQDEAYDIIGGAAGCILALLNLYRIQPVDTILSASVRCGDHLLAHGVRSGDGMGWLTSISKNKPLTGLSHGAAGIGWALLALSAAVGVDRFRHHGLAAIRYERGMYCARSHNWPDFRDAQERGNGLTASAPCQTAWCHGAPGIALARLASLSYVADGEMIREIDIALHTTVASSFVDNDSLCHGELGNLEPLLIAARTSGFGRWGNHFTQAAAKSLHRIDHCGWRCANPLGVDSPGLMTGLAGIGYGLLRIAVPDRVPSVLALAPPVSRN